MKLKFTFWLLLTACTIFSATADTVTNLPVPAPVQAKGTNDGPPKTLEQVFTNSADMVLLSVSGGMWAGKFEVTQKEYTKVTGANPSAFGGPTRPVDSVSWNDAMDFCKRLTDLDNKEKKLPDGFYYTLPTEDEWETLMADASLDDAVTSTPNDRTGTSAVGSMKPNSLGLYDTRGNVMEFCLGDDSKPYRVLRGGSWDDHIEINLRPIFRFYTPPDTRQNTFGFRCVLKKK